MFNKRKRSTRRWSVYAIEFMLVMVGAFLTATVLFGQPQVTEVRVIEPAESANVVASSTSNELVEASYAAALDYMRNKEYFKSAGLLDAITNEADHYWAHVSYSFVLYEMGEYDHALAVATEGIRINSGDPVAWNNRCLLHALTGDLQSGLNDCDQSIAVNPNYDYSHNNRCYILAEMDRLDEAEKSCYQALENDHRMPEWVYTNLGRIALKRGYDSQAMDMFMTALEHNPEHADAYAGLGDVMLIQSDFTQALDYYESYHMYAGVHYDDSYDAKVDYAEESLAFAAQN